MQFCNYCSYSSISLKSYLLPWTFFLSLEIPGSPKAYKARSSPGTVEDSIFLTPRDTCLGVVFLLPHTDPSWTCSHAGSVDPGAGPRADPGADPAGHRHSVRFTPLPRHSSITSQGCSSQQAQPKVLIEGWARTLPQHWQGQQGRHSMDSAKAGEKFSADFWGDHDFLFLTLLDSLLVYTGELGEVRKICWRKPGTYLLGEWQVTPCTWMELNPEQWEVLQIFRHHRQRFTEITVLSWKPGNSSRRRCGLGQCMWAKNFPSASAALKIWWEN